MSAFKLPSLKSTLYANTIFSTVCAVWLMAAAGWFQANIIDLPTLVFQLLGAGLLIFAFDVFWVARKLPGSQKRVWQIFAGEVIWVLGTPVLMALMSSQITQLGFWLLIDIAVIVGAFAVIELRWLRASDEVAAAS